MQLVLSNNRIVAHGENFISMGGTVINTVTGAKHENATIAECNSCPSDIDTVGYEYHAGTFVPCAPYGMGNNNGYFMEVCVGCAAPKNSGIPIRGGLSCENLGVLLWENTAPSSSFYEQTVSIQTEGYAAFIIVFITFVGVLNGHTSVLMSNSYENEEEVRALYAGETYRRRVQVVQNGIKFFIGEKYTGTPSAPWQSNQNYNVIPIKIYGVKL